MLVDQPYGGFLKWCCPKTMGFPTKNDHFGVFWGVPPFTETAIKETRVFFQRKKLISAGGCFWKKLPGSMDEYQI